MKYALLILVFLAGLSVVGAFALEWAGATLRPPQPKALGEVQWAYETGFTVERVERIDALTVRGHTLRPRGQFYVVTVRVLAPFGERYHWDDRRVDVRTFSGSGGTMPERRFAVDPRAQALLDSSTGRRAQHTVIGAEEHDRLVFDLPRDVEQPGFVFLDANDPWSLLDLLFGRFWQPARFNLRYD